MSSSALPLFEPAAIDPAQAEAPYRTIAEVIEAMTEQLAAFEGGGDHRAVFQRVYLRMTAEMERRLTGGYFDDQAWMERVLVAFAGFYFEALAAYDAGRPCPPAWVLALDAARGDAFVLEDALLGINAHINSDLPVVLAQILEADGAWPDARLMLHRRRDHERVNRILDELVDTVQSELTANYACLTGILDNVLGRSDECLSGRLMAHCRTTVWYQTEQLLDATGADERADVRRAIEAEALELGHQVRTALPFRLGRPLSGLTRRLRLL